MQHGGMVQVILLHHVLVCMLARKKEPYHHQQFGRAKDVINGIASALA